MKTLIRVTALVATFTLGLAAPSYARAASPDDTHGLQDEQRDEQVQPPAKEQQQPIDEGNKGVEQESSGDESLGKTAPGGEGTQSVKTMGLNEVPTAVKNTIEQEMKGGQLGTIKQKVKNGQTVYKAEIIKDGVSRHLLLGSDGQVLKRFGTDDLAPKNDVK
jgi:hypothetical protein